MYANQSSENVGTDDVVPVMLTTDNENFINCLLIN